MSVVGKAQEKKNSRAIKKKEKVKNQEFWPGMYDEQEKLLCLKSMLNNMHQISNFVTENEVREISKEIVGEQMEGSSQNNESRMKKLLDDMQASSGNFNFGVAHRILGKHGETSYPVKNLNNLKLFRKNEKFVGLMVHSGGEKGGHFTAVHHHPQSGQLFYIDGQRKNGKPDISILKRRNMTGKLSGKKIFSVWKFEENQNIRYGFGANRGLKHLNYELQKPRLTAISHFCEQNNRLRIEILTEILKNFGYIFLDLNSSLSDEEKDKCVCKLVVFFQSSTNEINNIVKKISKNITCVKKGDILKQKDKSGWQKVASFGKKKKFKKDLSFGKKKNSKEKPKNANFNSKNSFAKLVSKSSNEEKKDSSPGKDQPKTKLVEKNPEKIFDLNRDSRNRLKTYLPTIRHADAKLIAENRPISVETLKEDEFKKIWTLKTLQKWESKGLKVMCHDENENNIDIVSFFVNNKKRFEESEKGRKISLSSQRYQRYNNTDKGKKRKNDQTDKGKKRKVLHDQTDKGKKRKVLHDQTDKGKKRKVLHDQTDKGKKRKVLHDQTDKGKKRKVLHDQTDKGKKRKVLHDQTDKGKKRKLIKLIRVKKEKFYMIKLIRGKKEKRSN